MPTIVSSEVTIIWVTPDPLKMIETAGRVCYQSNSELTEETATKFIKKIIKNGHESVLEHASASFRIITDRGVANEIVRHRLSSFSQESTRYVNYGREPIKFIQPSVTSHQNGNMSSWIKSIFDAEINYKKMISEGYSPQEARSVLPMSLKTELIMTSNFRQWRNFLKLRLSASAHPDIRIIAEKIQNLLINVARPVFEEI